MGKGLVSDINTYLKWLTTTSLSMEEISIYISTVEEAKRITKGTKGQWQVITAGHANDTTKVRMVVDHFVNNGNGNGGNHNGDI